MKRQTNNEIGMENKFSHSKISGFGFEEKKSGFSAEASREIIEMNTKKVKGLNLY